MAAGIVNPITGRRFVKSWRIEELLPEADRLYAELEAYLGVRFHHHQPLVRTIHNRGDQNWWDVRGGEAGYPSFLDDKPDLGDIRQITRPAFAYGGVRGSSRVDIRKLTLAYRSVIQAGLAANDSLATSLVQIFYPAELDYNELTLEENGVIYAGDLRVKKVIFCEGWRARNNPWFGYLPHRGAKGEVLDVVLTNEVARSELEVRPILKHHLFLVPRQAAPYWVGATTENTFENEAPTPAGRANLVQKLESFLSVPYRIENHRAAVRPTVRDRRPLLGVHPHHPNLYIFNGLGTKGASLAPLCSRWLSELILKDRPLPPEVDIKRF